MENIVLLTRPTVFTQTLFVDLNGNPLIKREVPIVGVTLKEPPFESEALRAKI